MTKPKKTYLTREGYEKLRQELELLKTAKRRELSQAVGRAREMGDISENAEYDAAKEAQAHNEKRIAELEAQLAHVELLDQSALPSDQVLIGATVGLVDVASKEELEYTLVAEAEADYTKGKISVTSPIGRALIGHKQGDAVEIRIPAGLLKYKITKISRKG